MILLSESLLNVPIMSLQSGTELARTGEPIIDPRSLSIEALYVSGPSLDASPSILHVSDIRETAKLGFIVDDNSKLMPLDDLVRLQEIINFGFSLLDNNVVDEQDKKIGKVEDFTYEPASFNIQQIYVRRPLLKSFSQASVIIGRTQIISVTNEKIVVRNPTIKVSQAEKSTPNQAFVNPFRSPAHPEPESFRID